MQLLMYWSDLMLGSNPLFRLEPTRDHPAHLRAVLASYLGGIRRPSPMWDPIEA